MGDLNAPLGVEDTITLSVGFDATPFWHCASFLATHPTTSPLKTR
jgi:hypothetical protein